MNDNTRLFLNAPFAFGWGSLAHLGQLEGSRAAIVTDEAMMEQLGFLQAYYGNLPEELAA
ncbi:MAG: hypothetical protein ACE5H9_00400 [Anaerolineae bacterium]